MTHPEFILRSMADEQLDDLVQRLERQVRDMAQASTALGAKLCEQYRGALTAARIERQRRACDL